MSTFLYGLGVLVLAVLVALGIVARASHMSSQFGDYPSENGDGED